MFAALLSISVEFEPNSLTKVSSRETIAWTVRRLIDILSSERRSVTLAATDPSVSQEIRWALDADCGHEAALAASSDWSGYANGRSRFAAELLRRQQRARQAGIAITTMAVSGGVRREHLELLVRQGISAIRTDRFAEPKLAHHRPAASGVTLLRYGLWQFASDLRFAGGGWLAEQLTAGRICRAIDRRIAAGLANHLTIDAASLAERASAKLGGLKIVLRHLKRRQREGLLEVGTISDIVARLAPAPRAAQRGRFSALRETGATKPAALSRRQEAGAAQVCSLNVAQLR